MSTENETPKHPRFDAVITGVGAIRHRFEISLDGPGYYELQGPPESGKDTIIRGLTRACEPDIKGNEVSVCIDIKPDRGKPPRGMITIPGKDSTEAGVYVYAGKVTKIGPIPAVRAIDAKLFLSLTRPARSEFDAARRLELDTFAQITLVECFLHDLVAEDVMPHVAHLPKGKGSLTRVQYVAWEALHAAKGVELGNVASLKDQLKVLESRADEEAQLANDVDLEAASKALEALKNEHLKLSLDRATRIGKEQERARLAENHPAEAPKVEPISQRLEAVRTEAAALASRLEAARNEAGNEPRLEAVKKSVTTLALELTDMDTAIARLREELARKEGERAAHAARLDAARAELRVVETSHTTWTEKSAAVDELTRLLEAKRSSITEIETQERTAKEQFETWNRTEKLLKDGIEGPTQEDVDRKLEEVVRAREALEAATSLMNRKKVEKERLEDVAKASAALNNTQALAKKLEHAAIDGLNDNVRRCLELANIKGWSTKQGILNAVSPKRMEMMPFYALSDSTRDGLALELLMRHAKKEPGIISAMFIPQIQGDGMIDAQKRSMAQWAREFGIYVIGASVSDGELKLVSY